MNYKIYIESLNGFPAQEHGVSALLEFRARQANIIFFEEIDEVPVNKMNIVIGCIETTNKYFEKLGLSPKMALNIPKEIQKYAKRGIKYTNMKDFRDNAKGYIETNNGTFVKGNGKAKVFVPGVIKNEEQVRLFFRDVSDDEPILLSEPVNFISEYRTYVCNGEILGIKHYLGDFFIFPNPEVIKNAIKDYISAPVGYVIDFGITDKGETLLVEINDGFCIGNYGLEDNKYVKLLCARWLELMKEI